jgi:predicted DNA-binding WGR domain protein
MEPALPPRIIHLRARDPARNIARDYSIAIARDLFGHWIVETCWGRIGARGQRQQRSFMTAATAQDYVQSILKKGIVRTDGSGSDIRSCLSTSKAPLQPQNLDASLLFLGCG